MLDHFACWLGASEAWCWTDSMPADMPAVPAVLEQLEHALHAVPAVPAVPAVRVGHDFAAFYELQAEHPLPFCACFLPLHAAGHSAALA